jgi:hypothetical protein
VLSRAGGPTRSNQQALHEFKTQEVFIFEMAMSLFSKAFAQVNLAAGTVDPGADRYAEAANQLKGAGGVCMALAQVGAVAAWCRAADGGCGGGRRGMALGLWLHAVGSGGRIGWLVVILLFPFPSPSFRTSSPGGRRRRRTLGAGTPRRRRASLWP